jgi:hypothetical protein
VRAIAIAIVLAACGGDGKTSAGKSEVTCGASWDRSPPVAGTCDEACVEMTTGTGPTCNTGVIATGGTVICQTTFEVDGEAGCCFDLQMPGRVTAPNEPTRDRRVFFLSCKD